MAAPRGNQFWKLRTRHGRKALFDSAELFVESAYKYFDWCDKHPWHKQEPVKSGAGMGTIIEVPIARPYSLSGLCTYLGCSQGFFHQLKRRSKREFLEALEMIENIIETQQFEGAVVGAFNPSIIARKLGLREQTDITSNGQSMFKIEVIDEKTKDDLTILETKLS